MMLEKGKKYKCTCFNGKECTVVGFTNDGLVEVMYGNRIYLASYYNLYK